MDSLLRLAFVLVLVTAAWADIDLNVCSPVFKSCGPVTPPLPTNFELKGAYVDNNNKSMGYEEIYFDFDHLRGKHVMLSEGLERHLIFDYNVSQVIEYLIVHPGSNVKQDPLAFGCSATDIEDSPYRNIFGYRFSPNGITNSLMYDSIHVLRFGGPYQYAYNGSSSDDDYDEDDGRGLEWNAFIGCIYENDPETTAEVRYKFSTMDMLTSGGNQQTDIDGSGIIEPLSVPLAVDYSGNTFVPTSGESRTKVAFNVSQSFSWFRANPVFDKKNMQIPPWIHCDKYAGYKSMPNFPRAFYTRVETTSYTQDLDGKKITAELVSVEQIYYYFEKGLARRDFTPEKERDSEILSKFGNGSPVKEVSDFMSLQIYTINKATGRCFSKTLSPDSRFSKPKDTMFTEMATPEELFRMEQEDMEYKGQYFTRDIECDVWNGKYYDKDINLTFYKETYLTTNGWHSEVDENIEYRVPIKHSIITNQDKKEFERTVVENNFLKFNAYPPVLVLFDISECVETTEHKYFAIKLTVPEGEQQDTLRNYRFIFLESAQYYLATVSDLVSPLRIQKLRLRMSKSGIFLTFAMLEKPGVTDGILNPSKGVNVEDAAANLKKVIDEKNFEILYVHPLNKEQIPVVADPGSLYEWYPVGRPTASPSPKSAISQQDKLHAIDEHSHEDLKPVLHEAAATETPKKKKAGMSGGALAGLGIGMLLIGIAIGIAVMYLYFRKYSENSVSSDYAMHTAAN